VGQSDVLAYFSIAPTQVLASELTHALAGGYSIVPAYLLARLALDQGLQGQGLGGELLIDALSRIVDASASGGGRLIVVDAIDEGAIAFYQHHDFIAIGDSRRLYIKIVTAERIISPSK
jgi:GNAT superfamily N-acetyltransferase